MLLRGQYLVNKALKSLVKVGIAVIRADDGGDANAHWSDPNHLSPAGLVGRFLPPVHRSTARAGAPSAPTKRMGRQISS